MVSYSLPDCIVPLVSISAVLQKRNILFVLLNIFHSNTPRKVPPVFRKQAGTKFYIITNPDRNSGYAYQRNAYSQPPPLQVMMSTVIQLIDMFGMKQLMSLMSKRLAQKFSVKLFHLRILMRKSDCPLLVQPI